MNLWLLTWEGTDQSITDSNKIAGILSSRLSESIVERYAELLYQQVKFDILDIAHFANRRNQLHSQFRKLHSSPGRYFFGKNPFIFARRVKNFEGIVDENNDCELVHWVENAVFGNATTGSGIVELEPELSRSIIRPRGKTLMQISPDA